MVASYGCGTAIAAQGSHDEVVKTLNRYYNFGITSSEPIFLNEKDNAGNSFAYVLSDKEKMLKGFSDMAATGLISSTIHLAKRVKRQHRRFCGVKGGVMSIAPSRAAHKIESLTKEDFLTDFSSPADETNLLGEEKQNSEE